MVNLFLGWTFLGWVVALAWAFSDNTKLLKAENKKKKEDIKLDFMDILDQKKCQELKNWEEVVEKIEGLAAFKAAPEDERFVQKQAFF